MKWMLYLSATCVRRVVVMGSMKRLGISAFFAGCQTDCVFRYGFFEWKSFFAVDAFPHPLRTPSSVIRMAIAHARVSCESYAPLLLWNLNFSRRPRKAYLHRPVFIFGFPRKP
mmetsp:Transcript_104092/g.190674  ORF Transcript_104092/g.190674 Transcript_104092/m.190674 type:complete len:113 (-) Transcript_104092:30-368(-)